MLADLTPRTFYVRLLVEAEPATVSSCKDACATSFKLVREAGVVEVSCLSCEWAAKVKAEVCVPGRCRHCLLLEGRLAVSFREGPQGLSPHALPSSPSGCNGRERGRYVYIYICIYISVHIYIYTY